MLPCFRKGRLSIRRWLIRLIFGEGVYCRLALTISLYANNLFVVLSLPFLLCIVSSRLVVYSGNAILRGMAINKMFYMPQSSPTTYYSMGILLVALLFMGYVFFNIKGARCDVL